MNAKLPFFIYSVSIVVSAISTLCAPAPPTEPDRNETQTLANAIQTQIIKFNVISDGANHHDSVSHSSSAYAS